MEPSRIEHLKATIQKLHTAVAELKQTFTEKQDGFTLDGRLMGDIGEVIAAELFQIKLHSGVAKYYDAIATYNPALNIQIKTTFKDKLTYNHNPDYYIGIQLNNEGKFKVVYNGRGEHIRKTFKHRKHIGEKLLSFPVKKLHEISDQIDDSERILMKEGIEEKLKALMQ